MQWPHHRRQTPRYDDCQRRLPTNDAMYIAITRRHADRRTSQRTQKPVQFIPYVLPRQSTRYYIHIYSFGYRLKFFTLLHTMADTRLKRIHKIKHYRLGLLDAMIDEDDARVNIKIIII